MSEDLVPIVNDLNQRGYQGSRMSTSLDVTKPETRAMMLQCLQDCDARLTENVGNKIVVTDYLIHDVECKNQKTGEVTPAERLVLIDKDGLLYECVAASLISSLRNIAALFGRLPWPEGKTLIPRMKRKGEKNIYFFEVV